MNIASYTDIFRAYAAVLFLKSPLAGLVIFASTLYYPNIGVCGLLGAGIAYITTRLWQLPDFSAHVQIFNSLLLGLSIGAFYQLNIYVFGIIVLGAVLTSLLATVLADWMWRLDRLPVLSLPFVISAGLMSIVAKNYTDLSDYMGLTVVSYQLLTPSTDAFFSALGSIYFSPTPVVGMVIFVVLLLNSRYLALLAIIGYVIGYNFLTQLLFEPLQGFVVWTSFNFILVAIALGGIFTITSISSLAFSIFAVLLSVLLVVASKNLLLVEGLPVMAISFVITTLVILVAMKKRQGINQPYLAPKPGFPELNYELARLSKFRSGDINSVPLLVPVFGVWSIYQGFNGKHTHKAPWQYALDFFIINQESSYGNNGDKVEDYYCYNAPIISPAHGEIVRVYDKYADNKPGEVDTQNNWGNFILIRLDSGLHLLLAHLKQDSITIQEKTRVEPGRKLASCGNSGRSPQPHLHMQVQKTAELGSPTQVFHLCSLLLHKPDGSLEYQVISSPKEGDEIEATIPDEQLTNQLHLPVGREFVYQYSSSELKKTVTRQLTVELTLLGQFRLRSDSGASAAFEESNGVLGFYDRSGPRDILLDIWLLANGLTPLTESAHHWSDAPSALLLPMTTMQKIKMHLTKPLGCGLETHYERHWDESRSVWIQNGIHTFKLVGRKYLAETSSIIDPQFGYRHMTLKYKGIIWNAELLEAGLIGDRGIQSSSEPVKAYVHHEH